MAQDKSRYWTPSRTYEFALKIGKKDITPDLYKLTILTSIDVPYQTFVLELFLDPADFLLEEIYGQTPLKLSSKLFATSERTPLEQIDFDLMFLTEDIPIETQMQSSQEGIHGEQKDRIPITITAVARKPYITMNTFVNGVFNGSTINSAISQLVSNTNASLKYDTNGRNSLKIDQILVPPATLYKNLMYLNRTFGIFDGVPAFFCLYDDTIYIKNLTRKMKESNLFTIYQLALDANNDEIYKKANDGKTFYTVDKVFTDYKGNAAFASIGPRMRHRVKPSDRLYYDIDISLDGFTKNYGLISKQNRIFYDTEAINPAKRIAFHKDHTGYETSETFIRGNLSKNIASLSEMNIILKQSIKILNLMNVGESVQFNSKSDEPSSLTGRYILKASELSFTKAKDWESSAALKLIRTNRTVT
jgi:hypothetical protein